MVAEAWIALQRNGRMSLARPAAGGESCFAGFFLHNFQVPGIIELRIIGKIMLELEIIPNGAACCKRERCEAAVFKETDRSLMTKPCFFHFFFKIIEIKGAVFGKRIAYLVAVAGKEAFALCQNFLFLHPVARQKRIKFASRAVP